MWKVLQGCVSLRLTPICSLSCSWSQSLFLSSRLLLCTTWVQFSLSHTNVLISSPPLPASPRGAFQFMQWANSLPSFDTVHSFVFLETFCFLLMLLGSPFQHFFASFSQCSSWIPLSTPFLKWQLPQVTPHGQLLFSVHSSNGKCHSSRGLNLCLNICGSWILRGCPELPTGHFYVTKCPENGHCDRCCWMTIPSSPWCLGPKSCMIQSVSTMNTCG